MERPLRKPRTFFETAPHASHVTFDDGHDLRRNFPWNHYVEAWWRYGEPDTIQVHIGECVVVLTGSNLTPLFAALEEQMLFRVKAEADEKDREWAFDSYVTKITFEKPVERPPPQREFDFNKRS
jgi:hypothetical protein